MSLQLDASKMLEPEKILKKGLPISEQFVNLIKHSIAVRICRDSSVGRAED
jgi:hypothetical protein